MPEPNLCLPMFIFSVRMYRRAILGNFHIASIQIKPSVAILNTEVSFDLRHFLYRNIYSMIIETFPYLLLFLFIYVIPYHAQLYASIGVIFII